MNKQTPILVFKPVKSSQIKEIAYNESSETLYVKFINGDKTYSYSPVSAETHAKLMSADSIGKYYYANIRKAVTGQRINPEKLRL